MKKLKLLLLSLFMGASVMAQTFAPGKHLGGVIIGADGDTISKTEILNDSTIRFTINSVTFDFIVYDQMTHDSLLGVDPAEHVAWELDGLENIYDTRITSSSVTQHEGNIDHDALANYDFYEHIDWTNSGVQIIAPSRISEIAVTQHETGIDHNNIENSGGNSHIDWISYGPEDIHQTRLAVNNPTTNELLGTNADNTYVRYLNVDSLVAASIERILPGFSTIDEIDEIDNNTLRFTVGDRYYDVTAPITEPDDTTNIYVAQTGGSDANDGYSVATPIKSISYLLSNFYLDPGDTVFFNKNDDWRLTTEMDLYFRGASGNHITFTSYGSGDKPRILGSALSTAWSDEGSNVWSSTTTFPNFNPVDGMIWFHDLDDSIKWGKYESGGTGNVDEAYDFYYNAATDILYVYSTSNPAAAFTSVEVPIIANIIELQAGGDSAEYYTFDGIEFAFSLDMGIRSEYPGGITGQTRSLKGLQIRNCNIHHIGIKNGSDDYGIHIMMSDVIIEDDSIYDIGRRGISIAPDGNLNSDSLYRILIQDCHFYNGYHTTGPDIQADGPASTVFDSIVIRRCIIEEESDASVSTVGMLLQSDGDPAKLRRVWVYNNLFKYSNGSGIQLATPGNTSNLLEYIYIHNNTFYDFSSNYAGSKGHVSIDSAAGYGYYENVYVRNNLSISSVSGGHNLTSSAKTGMAVDYNLYYSTHGSNAFIFFGTSYTQAQWAAYKSASGFDANSPAPADPKFHNPPDTLNVIEGSPAVDAGVAISGYTTDYAGVSVGSPPNIGAYETVLVTGDTTNWYFADDGSDANNGHSPLYPKASQSALEALSLEAGDTVFFKKGDTWRFLPNVDGVGLEMGWRGAVGNHITFTSYGIGAKPRLLGSVAPASWTQDGADDRWWTVEAPDTFPGGRVIFHDLDDSLKWGELEHTRSAVDSAYQYYHSNDTTYIYSESNPSTAFTSIEIPQCDFLIRLDSRFDSTEYITFDDIEMAYVIENGIFSRWPGGISGQTRSARGFELRNCELHHMGRRGGGGYGIQLLMSDVIIENNEFYDMGRRGISIAADASIYSTLIENIIIQDNHFHTGWHCTGPDIENYDDVCVFDSIIIRRNIIEDDPTLTTAGGLSSMGCFIQFAGSGSAAIQNVWCYNNLIKYVKGAGAFQIEAVDSLYIHNNTIYGVNENGGYGMYFTLGTDTTLIRNNIFYINTTNATAIYSDATSGYNVDYNLYYHTSTSTDMWDIDGTDYAQDGWAAYKTGTGFDANSPTPADPSFYNAPNNLRVNGGSPAIGAGVTIPGYTTDYEGVTVSSPPNTGAYETAVVSYLTPTNWINDSINRYYTTGVASFSGDPYFDEGGVITYGNEVASAAAVLNGDVYDYYNDGGTFYVNYDWADTTGAVITPLAGDTIRPVDVHGALNVSGRYLRNEDNDTIVLRGYGIERQSDVWGYTRFANLSFMQYARDEHSAQVLRVTLPVEINKTVPADDFYFADSVNRIADMKTFVDYAIAAGMYVIINWHEFVTTGSPGGSHLGSAIYFWEQMATEYDGVDNVIFEIYNEARNFAPYDYSWATDIKPYADAVIDAIRAIDVDESNIIIVGVDDYDADFSNMVLSPITGHNNIMYALHFYAAADPAAERNAHSSLIVANNIPVFMTEGGAMSSSGYAPFDLDNWYDWYDWMDTMKISSAAWYLGDHVDADNAMLKVQYEPVLYQVSPTGFWKPGDTDFRQWGREAQYMMKAKDLPNHVTIGIPEGASTTFDNITAAYNLDGNADDDVGSIDGTVYGATSLPSGGKDGGCYDFDGSNDSIGFGGNHPLTSQTFAVSLWFEATVSGANRAIIGEATSSGGIELRISDDDYFEALEQNISIIVSTDPVSEGVWHHVLFNYDVDGNYEVYVDGSLEESGTNNKTLIFNGLRIGSQAGSEFFDGKLDAIYFFDGVNLSSSDASWLYNAGSGNFYPN